MEKKKFNHLQMNLYHEVLDNGLNVFIVPKKDVKNKFVTFTTRYGSTINEFIPLNKREFVTVPAGVAHFLEHKIFEQESELEPFDFYNKNGADVNAYTSFYGTTFHFSGPSNFEENLNYLLDFVQNIYLTDENVLKEKGIIIEEIKMHSDNPYRIGLIELIASAFLNHPINISIIGSEESVNSITKENLLECYNTFYNPSNMFLIITGNVDPKKTIKIIKGNQNKKNIVNGNVVVKKYEEPDIVARKEYEIKMNVTNKKAFVGYKINYSKLLDKYSEVDILRNLSIYINIKFDATSNINQNLINKKIITDDMAIDSVKTDKHILYMFYADTENCDEFFNSINEEITDKHILESDFIRKKRSYLSSNIYMSDNIFRINNKILNFYLMNNYVETDYYSIYKNLNINILNDIIKELDFNNVTKLIIKS